MDAELLRKINQARAERRALAVVTDLESGDKRLIEPEAASNDPLSEAVTQRFRSGKSGVVETSAGEVFIQMHVPPPRLVCIGAVHITQALAPMAQACGFDVRVIDPRTAFATAGRFAGVELHAEWPDEILRDEPLDAFTALVAVTHDPKIDDHPLMAAIEANSFYIGALGSRKTHAKRVDRLKASGMSEAQLQQIAAPIGLDIGAASPPEIAVAVMAQIIEALRKPARADVVGKAA